MLAVLANRTYRHLFAAQVIALIGTALLTVALGLLAYDLAGGQASAVLGTALAIKMVAYGLHRRLPRTKPNLATQPRRGGAPSVLRIRPAGRSPTRTSEASLPWSISATRHALRTVR